MSIASAITTKQQQVADSYTAVSNKGGTLPQTQNLTNLATAISSIPNGEGGIGIPREVKNGVYQMPTENFTFSLPNDASNVGTYGLAYAFYGCIGLTNADLSALTTVSGSYGLSHAFDGCTRLTSIDLSSLTTVSDSYSLSYAFRNCTGLTSIDLSSLTTVSGGNGLNSAFNGCTGLTDIYFRALTTSSFGSYKNQFNFMMQGTGTSKTHTIHFPSNMESTISGLTGYPLFGGTSGKVVLSFDLPATS